MYLAYSRYIYLTTYATVVEYIAHTSNTHCQTRLALYTIHTKTHVCYEDTCMLIYGYCHGMYMSIVIVYTVHTSVIAQVLSK
jgi:hypothetical protein